MQKPPIAHGLAGGKSMGILGIVGPVEHGTLQVFDIVSETTAPICSLLEDDNGFVIKASSKQMQMEYRYDDQGYPLGKTTKSNDKNQVLKKYLSLLKRKM